MKIVVSHLSRKRFSGDVCGGTARLSFLKDGKSVHCETFNGKCLSRYIRIIPDFDYNGLLLDCDEATSFIYEIEEK